MPHVEHCSNLFRLAMLSTRSVLAVSLLFLNFQGIMTFQILALSLLIPAAMDVGPEILENLNLEPTTSVTEL